MDALSAVLQVDLRLKLETFGGQTNRNQNRLCLGEVDGRIVKAGSQSRMNNIFKLLGLFIFGLVARLTMNRLISQLESQLFTDYLPNVFGPVNGGCLAVRVGSPEHDAHTTIVSFDDTCRINRFHMILLWVVEGTFPFGAEKTYVHIIAKSFKCQDKIRQKIKF